MTPQHREALAVIQADRDAAADTLFASGHSWEWCQRIRRGEKDGYAAVQAFAAHRLAFTDIAHPQADREAIARTVFGVLNPHETWDSFNERFEARGGVFHPMQLQAFEVADAILSPKSAGEATIELEGDAIARVLGAVLPTNIDWQHIRAVGKVAAQMLANPAAPGGDCVQHSQPVEVLSDPSHMKWQDLRTALWDRLKDDEREDGDLTFSRDEGCALLAWAELFDRQAQPRRDEEQKTFDIIGRAAELLKPGEGEVVFNLRISGDHTHLTTHAAKGVEPQSALTTAINALIAERKDAENCPVHAQQSEPPAPDGDYVLVPVDSGARELIQKVADFLDTAAGEDLELGGIDALELVCELHGLLADDSPRGFHEDVALWLAGKITPTIPEDAARPSTPTPEGHGPATSEQVASEPDDDESDDAPCTDCGDTGITFQTERRCACQPHEGATPTPDNGGALREALHLARIWFELALAEGDPGTDFLNEGAWEGAQKILDDIRAALSPPSAPDAGIKQ